ncbi:hypothetical protein CEXT_245021 [Caerostris extrusa]|uniref:Uncharacterized protein n=1 Tax=Caerostris extrusa TaxID=172846 RepID=A0AAV4V3N8_CAEEX|nr:hypothetical protein CEXT_245021 [Caerostris extrusa]
MGSTRGGWRVDWQATMTAVKVITWVLRGDFAAERILRAGSPALYYFSPSVISIVFISRGVVGQLIDGVAKERLFADNVREIKQI